MPTRHMIVIPVVLGARWLVNRVRRARDESLGRRHCGWHSQKSSIRAMCRPSAVNTEASSWATRDIGARASILLHEVALVRFENNSRVGGNHVDRTSRLALDVASQMGLVALEIWMVELPALGLGVPAVHVGFLSVVTIDFVESIHVQLADKTLPIVVLEELWQD